MTKEKESPEDQNQELKKVSDTIESLQGTVEELAAKTDEIEGKMSTIPPESPEKETEKKDDSWKPNTWDDVSTMAEQKATAIIEQREKERQGLRLKRKGAPKQRPNGRNNRLK